MSFLFRAALAGFGGGNQWWGVLLAVAAARAAAVDDAPVGPGMERMGGRGRGLFFAGGVGGGGGRGRGTASDLPWGSLVVSGRRNVVCGMRVLL